MKSLITLAEASSSSSLLPVSKPPPLHDAIIRGVNPSGQREREGAHERMEVEDCAVSTSARNIWQKTQEPATSKRSPDQNKTTNKSNVDLTLLPGLNHHRFLLSIMDSNQGPGTGEASEEKRS